MIKSTFSFYPSGIVLDAQFIEHLDEFFVHGLALADGIDEGNVDHFVVAHAYHHAALALHEGFDGTNAHLRGKDAVAG